MSKRLATYERLKQEIRLKKANEQLTNGDWLLDEDDGEVISVAPRRKIDLLAITKVGTGVLIGGGLGLLTGVAAIAVSASVAEVVIGGVVTKIAGVVGGAAGLGWGLHSVEKKREREGKSEVKQP